MVLSSHINSYSSIIDTDIFSLCGYDVTSRHNTNCLACVMIFPQFGTVFVCTLEIWLVIFKHVMSTAVSCPRSYFTAIDSQTMKRHQRSICDISPNFSLAFLVVLCHSWRGWLLFMTINSALVVYVWPLWEETLLVRSNTNTLKQNILLLELCTGLMLTVLVLSETREQHDEQQTEQHSYKV